MAGRVRSGSTRANGIAAKAEVIEAVAAAETIEKKGQVAVTVAGTMGTRQL